MSYVLIDANEDHNWETIVGNVMYWKLAIGNLRLDFCDRVTVSCEDVDLLLDKAMMLISDREEYRDLAYKHKVPFVDVRQGTVEEIMERIDYGWQTRPTDARNSHV